MALNTNTIAMISVVIACVGMAWAIFWPVHGQPGRRAVSTHWDIVYVDDDGTVLFTHVRVLKVNPGTRRMTAWCSATGSERVLRLGKIVRATDVRSGARIDIAGLLERPFAPEPASRTAPGRLRPCGHDAAQAADAGGWWSASRLGLH